MRAQQPATIDAYIEGFPGPTRKHLRAIRRIIREEAPEALEKISFGIPTFTLNGKHLVYFGAFRELIGLYPVPAGHHQFEEAFAKYRTSGKGTIQFPKDEAMPLDLIARIVRQRILANLATA